MAQSKKVIPTIDENNKRIINVYKELEKNEILRGDYKEDEISDENEVAPSKILKIARQEAELLLEDARKRAMEIEQEGYKRGYEEGYKSGEEKYKEDISAQKEELIRKAKALETHFEKKLKSYEPKIAGIIRKLVTQLVGSTKDEDIIIFLVKLALAENNSKGKVVLNVSKEDYDKVVSHIEEFGLEKEEYMSLEVKKNTRLGKNDCILETSFGVIDSSLNVRVDSFIKEIDVIKQSLYLNDDE